MALLDDGETVIEQVLALSVTKGDKIEVVCYLVGSFSSTGGKLFATIYVEDGLPTAYGGTSASSIAISTGAKSFTTQAGLAYSVGSRIRVASSAAPTADWIEGIVTGYSGTTLAMTADLVSGSGTHTDWLFSLAGARGAAGATGATGPQGDPGDDGADGADGAAGVVQSIVAGTNVTVDDSDPANPVVSASGGGGGGSALRYVYNPDAPFSSPSAVDEEFDQGSLNTSTKWTAIGTCTLDWSYPGCMGFLNAGGNIGGFVQPTGGGDFVYRMKMSLAMYPASANGMGFVVRGVGVNYLTTIQFQDQDRRADSFHWIHPTFPFTAGTTSHVVAGEREAMAHAIYLQARYVDSTKTIYWGFSWDGIHFYEFGNDVTQSSFAVDRIGFWTARSDAYDRIHWFRKIQGGTHGSPSTDQATGLMG
jgi:hypothetical protein